MFGENLHPSWKYQCGRQRNFAGAVEQFNGLKSSTKEVPHIKNILRLTSPNKKRYICSGLSCIEERLCIQDIAFFAGQIKGEAENVK